jgi:hypothetical protein
MGQPHKESPRGIKGSLSEASATHASMNPAPQEQASQGDCNKHPHQAAPSDLSRAPGQPAQQGPASGRCGNVQSRATEGRVAVAKVNAQIMKSPQRRMPGGTDLARQPAPPVSQGPEQRHRLTYSERQKKRPASRKQNEVQPHTHATMQSYAKRSQTENPKPTHGAQSRPKPPRPRAGHDRASGPGQRLTLRHTRPTDTGTRCSGTGQQGDIDK